MARREKTGWYIAGALALLTFGAAGVALIKTHSTPPAKRAEIEAQARKWGPVFGTPVATIMALAKIESGWRPDTVNYSVRSIPLGGAWGPLQMTKVTADDWAGRLTKSQNPEVAKLAGQWKGDGQALIDNLPLAVMMSAAFLGKLTGEFKTFENVAAAYHQGAGKVRQMLRDKLAIPSQLPPKGKQYVALALAARKVVVA